MRKLIGRILLWFIDDARPEVTHTFEIGGFCDPEETARQISKLWAGRTIIPRHEDGDEYEFKTFGNIVWLGDPEKLN